MGEVTEMFDVNPSLIRFWESKFDILKPHKNKKGNRLFTPADIDNLKLIYHLVKEKGMTLTGAAQQIKANKGVLDRDLEVIERLLSIKAILAEIKQELKVGADFETEPEEEYIPTPAVDAAPGDIPQPGHQAPEPDSDSQRFTFLADELDIIHQKEEFEPEHEAAPWDITAETGKDKGGEVRQIVERNITEIAGEELPNEYIGELSDEIAREAAIAAEVMEALAELDKSKPKGPEVLEQTLF